jgi:hypothetical protein
VIAIKSLEQHGAKFTRPLLNWSDLNQSLYNKQRIHYDLNNNQCNICFQEYLVMTTSIFKFICQPLVSSCSDSRAVARVVAPYLQWDASGSHKLEIKFYARLLTLEATLMNIYHQFMLAHDGLDDFLSPHPNMLSRSTLMSCMHHYRACLIGWLTFNQAPRNHLLAVWLPVYSPKLGPAKPTFEPVAGL